MALADDLRNGVSTMFTTLRDGDMLASVTLVKLFGRPSETRTNIQVLIQDTPTPGAPADADDEFGHQSALYLGHLDVTPNQDAIEMGGTQRVITNVTGPVAGNGQRFITEMELAR